MTTPFVREEIDDWSSLYVPNKKLPKDFEEYLNFKYVPREKWGAVPPTAPGFSLTKMAPLPYMMVTHTDSDPCYGLKECSRLLRKLQRRHIDKECLPDIKYNWIIGDDGRIYEGAGWSTAVYWATPSHNPYIYNSITVAFTDPANVDEQMGRIEKAFQRLLMEGVYNKHLALPLEEFTLY